MAYHTFKMDVLQEKFGIQTNHSEDYFALVPPIAINPILQAHLDKYVPLGIAMGSEKARSELIVTPVLLEVLELCSQKISLFSGVEFNPDPKRGLKGTCDYLIALSPEQFTVTDPVVALVEAKKDDIRNGIAQCIAEMIGAQVFNAPARRNVSSRCPPTPARGCRTSSAASGT